MNQVTLSDQVPVTFRLPKELYDRLVTEAQRRTTPVRKVGLSEVLRDLVDKGC